MSIVLCISELLSLWLPGVLSRSSVSNVFMLFCVCAFLLMLAYSHWNFSFYLNLPFLFLKTCLFSFIYLFTVYMCMYTSHTWRSEGNLQQSLLSFHLVGSWGQTQVCRVGGKDTYPLGYCAPVFPLAQVSSWPILPIPFFLTKMIHSFLKVFSAVLALSQLELTLWSI